MASICFLGVGKMGLHMAIHLLQAGHAVAVSDPSSERLALAQGAGLALAEAGTLGPAEFVFSSLPHDAALLAVGEQVAQGARPGAVYVDTSTVSLGASARVAELCQVRGVQYLLYRYDREHSNFLRTLEALRARVEQRLGRG